MLEVTGLMGRLRYRWPGPRVLAGPRRVHPCGRPRSSRGRRGRPRRQVGSPRLVQRVRHHVVGVVLTARKFQEQVLGGGPAVGLLGQGPHDQTVQGAVQAADLRFGEQHPLAQGHGIATAEGVRAVAGEGHKAPPGEDVRGGGDLLLEELFGGHPPGAAHDDARLGVVGGGVHRSGDAEVDHPRPRQRQQHVRGFEVTVDQPRAVDGGQRRGHPQGEAVQGRGVQRPVLGDVFGQRGASDVLGHHVRPVLERAVVEDLRGAEGGDLAGVLHLVAEPRSGLFVEREFRADHLDGHLVVLVRQAAQVHGAHTAATQLPGQHVGTDGGRISGCQRFQILREPIRRQATLPDGVQTPPCPKVAVFVP